MGCTFLAITSLGREETELPSKKISPLVIFSSFRIILAMVLLPHPDSPTRPITDPLSTLIETPFTA